MRGSSLATRLFLSATAWVVVILLITGIVLSSVYRAATERAFDRRLNLYLRTLIAEVATPDEPPDHQFQSLGEPLFELPLSGWYWQITRTDTEKPEMRASRSLWDKKLPKLEEHGAELTAAGIRLGYVDGPEGQTLRMVERPVDLGADGKFLVSVAGDATEIFDETRSLRLLPRRHLRRAVDRAAADHDLPGPLWPRAAEAHFGFHRRHPLRPRRTAGGRIPGRDRAAGARDQRADRRQPRNRRARAHPCRQSRARHQDAAVGHRQRSLRASAPIRSPSKVLEQADVMRDQVAHHLERARIAARLTIIGTVTEVAPAIEALRRTMEKIHRDRGIAIEVEADAAGEISRRAAGSRGDGRQPRRQRLQMGAVAGVHRGAGGAGRPRPAPGPMLRIIVDDDGRGLSAAERAQVSRRGQRLDESKPGSGLGLSIVVDLAALYGGSLTLGDAPIGGLRAELVLPGV